MADSNVRLFPPTDTTPIRSRIPSDRAHRWVAPFEDGAKGLVSVFVTPSAFVRFCAHAGTDLEREVGGGLVGEWRFDERSKESFIVVESILPARFTRQGSAFLTFTQDTLVAMNDELDERYPDKMLVGWFHTHPRMSVFMSHFDVWMHRHFFPEPWQVALVIEPHTSVGGFFVRQEEDVIDPHRYFGFYELIEEAGSQVVHWTNLRSQKELADKRQEDEDE